VLHWSEGGLSESVFIYRLETYILVAVKDKAGTLGFKKYISLFK
jgi:hypothetical protein